MLRLDKQNYSLSRLNLDHEKRAAETALFFENPEITSENRDFHKLSQSEKSRTERL